LGPPESFLDQRKSILSK